MSFFRRLVAEFLAQPLKGYRSARAADLAALSAALRDGDVLLTDGNTRAAALIKRVTRSSWSHVSMYVGPLEPGPDPRCVVEADVAHGVRSIRLSELQGLNVRVLRPTGLSDAARTRLAEWVVRQIGREYDLKHAWQLAASLLRGGSKAVTPPAPSFITESATRFICSTLLANAFALVGMPVPSVIPGDFERAPVFEVLT